MVNNVGTGTCTCPAIETIKLVLNRYLWVGKRQIYPVTAPSEAEETEFAYFAMTPRV